MSEYEHSIVVEAAPEAVFDFVTNIQNAPILISSPSSAQTPETERAPSGWMRVYPGEYLMEWGSDGDQFYSGWLQIDEMDDTFSEITMHLSYPSRLDMGAASVDRDLQSAMQTIKQQVERRLLSSDTGIL
jgi:hypothetical protein